MIERADLDNAGVVDQDVNLAEAINDFPDSRLNLSGIQQIALDGQHGATAPGEISFCAREFRGIPCKQRDLTACGANLPRKHEPKSARSARDENNAVL
jgi:hypothetical protein